LDKKGFLFTVTVFLILVYILLSISVWVKSIEASERAFSESYKESVVELTIEQITPSKVDEVVRILMLRNLARLDEHALTYSVEEGAPGDENGNIRGSLFQLVKTGQADGSNFRGGIGLGSEANSSLSAWAGNLNASLKAIGVYVSDFEVTNFQVSQSAMDRVNYSVDIKLGLRDYANTSSVSRNYHISNSVGISGMVDPALARESRDRAGDAKTVYRQFFFKKDLYSDYTDVSVQKLSQPVQGGQGWLYGPLALASGSSESVPNALLVPDRAKRVFILVGTYDEITALGGTADAFAGFILTSAPTYVNCNTTRFNEQDTFNPITYSGTNCEAVSLGVPIKDKPFMVASGFDSTRAPECPLLDDGNTTFKCVLMQNTYLSEEVAANPVNKLTTTESGLFSVELFRDFVMCGYYTHNPDAPSFMQRLLNNSYSRSSQEFGIETFVIGVYANDTAVYDTNSRLDRELFDSFTDGIKVRGMPGCRNFASCSDSPATGIFAVSETVKNAYGLGGITCDNGAAGCD
jgi:hypothetical protein